jgi:[acyl-carrier-protein] S-malonyltransferase
MGRDLANNYPVAAQIFALAERELGFSLSRICFEGPAEELMQNDIVQPAILVTSVAALAVLEEVGIRPDVVAGLSVGEFTALIAAGSLNFLDALRLVRERGRIMREALPPGQGAMLALIGVTRDQVNSMCQEVAAIGLVEPCNYNCPGQIVVGGILPAIEALEGLAVKRGARKAVRVAMSSPSHCSLLQGAAQQFAHSLVQVNWRDAKIPVLSNVDARSTRSANSLRMKLARQLSEAVMWEDEILEMEKMGVTHLIEVGPGHTLTGFARKTTRRLKAANVEDVSTLKEVQKWINEAEGGEMVS